MNIKPAIYDKLTTRQRILATLEATARGDKSEVERLIESCPKKTYRMNDTAYSNTINALHIAAIIVEADLRGYALAFQMTMDKGKTLPDGTELDVRFLEMFASLQAAWDEVTTGYGIPHDLADKALGFSHPGVRMLEQLASDTDIEPDPELIAKERETLEEIIRRQVG